MRSSEPMASRLGRVCRALLLAALAALAGGSEAGAQDARGSISGRVTDPSGAVLPGSPGTYRVTATLDGFRRQREHRWSASSPSAR